MGRLTGRPGKLPVTLGFDSFYVAGSRLAYAAGLAELVDRATDEAERQDLAVTAFDQLDVCLARGEYPAQAALLKGAVYHRLGDLAAAVMEVEEALRLIDAQGDGPGYQAVLDQLAEVRVDRSPSEMAAFFGQSGSARSRWASVQDADANRDALRAAYAADPTDANRQALARFLIRQGDAAGGRVLVADHRGAADVVLTLEADRALGDADPGPAAGRRLRRPGRRTPGTTAACGPWWASCAWTTATTPPAGPRSSGPSSWTRATTA